MSRVGYAAGPLMRSSFTRLESSVRDDPNAESWVVGRGSSWLEGSFLNWRKLLVDLPVLATVLLPRLEGSMSSCS